MGAFEGLIVDPTSPPHVGGDAKDARADAVDGDEREVDTEDAGGALRSGTTGIEDIRGCLAHIRAIRSGYPRKVRIFRGQSRRHGEAV